LSGSGLKIFGIDFSADFHEFSIEWDRDQIRWFVDYQQFQSLTQVRSFWSKKGNNIYTSIRQPFDQKLQYVFSVTVLGKYFQRLEELTRDEAESCPKPSLEIDFVRVYQNSCTHRIFCLKFFYLLVLYTLSEWLSI
jgi:beta-glucanase (GH16 family)